MATANRALAPKPLDDDTAPATTADAASSSMSTVVQTATQYVQRPHQELVEVFREMSAIRLFWYDMRLRPQSWAHRTVLVAGLAVGLIGIAMCIGMAADDYVANREFVHYVILERVVAAVAQLLFSGRAIFVENKPLLIIANLNACGLVSRAAIKEMMRPVPNYLLLGLISAALLAHLIGTAVTIAAMPGGTSRFSIFSVGGEVHIQRMYSHYLYFNAIALLDLECAILAVATVFFFYDTHWYWFLAFGVFGFITVANGSLLRHMIRTEASRSPFAAIVPLYVALPAGVCVAMWYHDWIRVDIADDLKPLVAYVIICFIVSRLALLAAASKCFFNFDNGMKEAFAHQRDSVSFVREEAMPSYVNNVEEFFAQADLLSEPHARYSAE